MRVIAMYLPQFHRVPENDAWWGEGFTDWVSAKKATPLFTGHYQPHIPLNNNMYDLLDKSTMEWQADLIHQYGVDGLCFYHYWFENGKQILEKPAENLLEWKDINMPFCFSWANETWARSWGNVRDSNVWSDIEEPQDHLGKAVLLNQNYGNEKEWIAHFEYLLPFFKDSRYIKIDDKPIFHIYKAGLVCCLGDMLSCWKQLAISNGLPGIYFIGSHCIDSDLEYLDEVLITEPQTGIRSLVENTISSHATIFSYDDVWNNILVNESDGKTTYGGFVGYDDTPRRGINGIVIEGANPDKFEYYLTKLLAKNYQNGKQVTFINAWNEWGEGMHLEPDERFGFSYLERIKGAKMTYMSVEIEKEDHVVSEIQNIKKRCNKFEQYLNDMDLWMSVREKKVNLVNYLNMKGIKSFAIYGYGMMGKHLLAESETVGDSCKYIIDMQSEKIKASVPVFSPSDKLEEVDAIIVASYFYFDDIQNQNSGRLISLGSLIHEVYGEIFK